MIYYIIYPFSCLVGWLPLKIQLGVSAIIRWFLYYIIRYRVKVVRENLLNSFPQMSEKERREIEKRFYVNLGDVFVEIMVLASISEKNMRKRMVFTNYEQMEQNAEGRSCIAMLAHYGSWEYTSSYGIYTHHEAVYGVYRPLRNKGVDKYFMKCRSRFGSTPKPMDDIMKAVFAKRRSAKGVVVALIADQAPPRYENVPWLNFLNQPTQFFIGGEKMARLMKMPVFFSHVEQTQRGKYAINFEMIYDGEEDIEEFEILRRYAERLEQMIVNRPELWMWSHRRWKRKPLNDEHQQQ